MVKMDTFPLAHLAVELRHGALFYLRKEELQYLETLGRKEAGS